jgi:hypothetical protein
MSAVIGSNEGVTREGVTEGVDELGNRSLGTLLMVDGKDVGGLRSPAPTQTD